MDFVPEFENILGSKNQGVSTVDFPNQSLNHTCDGHGSIESQALTAT